MKEIFTRVSIRKYRPKAVEPEKITALQIKSCLTSFRC